MLEKLYYQMTQKYSLDPLHRSFIKARLTPLENIVELSNGVRIQGDQEYVDVFYCQREDKYIVYRCEEKDSKELLKIEQLGPMKLEDVKLLYRSERLIP